MEFFDSGHLASGLGDLDAVADEDGLEVDAKEAWVEPEDQSAPGVGELVQIQGRAMEEVQEPVVEIGRAPSPTRTGLRLTRRRPGSNRKTRAHQAWVSLSRSRAGLWKKSRSRS